MLILGDSTYSHQSRELSKVRKGKVEADYVFWNPDEIAERVMKTHGMQTNDMHQYVRYLINMDKPAGFGADPFHFDKKPIHMPIVQ